MTKNEPRMNYVKDVLMTPTEKYLNITKERNDKNWMISEIHSSMESKGKCKGQKRIREAKKKMVLR